MGQGLRLGRRLCVCWAKVRLARGEGWTGVEEQETFQVVLRTWGK